MDYGSRNTTYTYVVERRIPVIFQNKFNKYWSVSMIFTGDSIYAMARICHRNSVCLSVTWVDQPKAFEVRIMQFSPYSSPIPLVSAG